VKPSANICGSAKGFRAESAQASLEFVLMIPVFFIFFFLLIDFGVGMYGYVSIANAAREGARYGAVNCDGECTAAEIQTRAVSRSGGFITNAADVTVSWPDGVDRGDSVAVSISHIHAPIFFPAITWTIRSCAQMPLEQGQSGSTTGSGCSP
jgi:Flp pilus assembly protein TadG